RITSGGLVGIANNDPKTLLHVGDSSEASDVPGSYIHLCNDGAPAITARSVKAGLIFPILSG
ncbi:MAG: hypothetical protein ACYTEU_07965, partial [Planctomycetota bacterium]